MIWNVIKFEWKYRMTRPATWIYFLLLGFFAFAGIYWEALQFGTSGGPVKANSPFMLTMYTTALAAFGLLINSAVMGVPVLRDFEHKTITLMFTTPLKKHQYLIGRFIGSLTILLLILSSIPIGLMLGTLDSFNDPDRFQAFEAWNYLQPYLLWVMPNAIISGCLFFMGGTLSKRFSWVFVQGIILLVAFLITTELVGDLENKFLGGLLDPMGLNTVNLETQYWTAVEKNTQLVQLSGMVLWNRLIWMVIGIAALTLTFTQFSILPKGPKVRKAGKKTSSEEITKDRASIPAVSASKATGIQWKDVWVLSKIYFREVILSVPFMAISLMGLLILILNSTSFSSGMYGTDIYPTTYTILENLSGFNLFFMIIIVFYSGELIWRERDLKMNQIFDALPVSNFTGYIAKFIGMAGVHIVLLTLLMFVGIMTQALNGYFRFEIGLYISRLFTDQLLFLLLFTLMAMFIHSVVNQKFLGHGLVILVYVFFFIIMGNIGIEHRLFRFGQIGLGTYSDMNSYGHYVSPFSWFELYFVGFGMVLFAIAVSMSVRGTDTYFIDRIKLLTRRFSRPLLIFLFAAIVVFVGTGSFVFYNTNVLNEYVHSDDRKELQANYEKQLKVYQDIPQPRIVETNLEVDLFPEKRSFDVTGVYVLKNKTDVPIERLHIQEPAESDMKDMTFELTWLDSIGGKAAEVDTFYEDFQYTIFELSRPMMPGDSLQLDFKAQYKTVGFKQGGSNTSVVYNGTFFNNTYFPGIGYDPGFEMGNDDDRKDHDLPERERMRPRADSVGHKINLVGDDADHIRFEIVMSTSSDQIAIAPGYLQEKREEGDRVYYHYKMDAPMFNFYSMISARYEVVRDKMNLPDGKEIDLEIYYHKGHEYNLDRMMNAMKHSLKYYSEHFSPYQYRQMRIMEFPRYSTFAQSFANTVPFSEGIGFMLNIGKDDVDMVYYVTAHEMAHQWWGHQVTEAQVRGNAMLSESMSQYSALMVMKEQYGPELMQKFLEHELDRYLRGRSSESKKERPLELVESQGYIHYNKGSLVMYALQDYIGDDKINQALKQYVEDWAWRTDRYVTTDILLDYFEEVTPDSLQYLIDDLFKTITLYENRTKEVIGTELPDGGYLVDIQYEATKYHADSLGAETEVPFDEWIDVGVYTETEAGKDSLLYLKKHKIQTGSHSIQVQVDAKPTKAGIDPINILIDRNPDDNRKKVSWDSE
ncbi:M1 family aminopeptidase [Pontibacter sp. G13]|uniref:ABC transporter permease/M1 family aminopeptidase n=1 Tax=Pontibacter sp. G13 TaxID=3074898 RepID=UPI0028893567|nr:M1 family aminopeptidase [Pontibacter sp. G13]WNJ16822.1 M1 family aminopeptidase [Pontibacter sp. G13]